MSAAQLAGSEGLGVWDMKCETFHVPFLFQDMLTLLGEALSSFPKPSEDPRELWQWLKGKEMEKQNQA